MIRPLLFTAILTGVFCSGFAVFMLEQGQIIGISFVSGFLGSLFAQTVLRQWKDRQ